MTSARAWLDYTDNPDWVRGVIAAYAWRRGQRATTPISGEPVPPTIESMRREERLADDAIYRRVSTGVDRHFAAGAQNALLWLRGADGQPPISLGTVRA